MSNTCLAAVLQRLKQVTACTTDAELAKALGVSPQTLSSWKMRDRIPYANCIEAAQTHGLSLDWLLLGEGSVHRASSNDAAALEQALLQQLRTLSADDLQAIRLNIEDKLRIVQLQQQVQALSERLAEHD